MFLCDEFNRYCNNGKFDDIDGALLTFQSTDPKFSFLEMDETGNVINTVEKKAVSDKAICGAYYFKNKKSLQNDKLFCDDFFVYKKASPIFGLALLFEIF